MVSRPTSARQWTKTVCVLVSLSKYWLGFVDKSDISNSAQETELLCYRVLTSVVSKLLLLPITPFILDFQQNWEKHICEAFGFSFFIVASSERQCWLILKHTTKRNIHTTENPVDIRTGYLQNANRRSYRYINLLGEIHTYIRYRCSALDLYLGDARFDSRPGLFCALYGGVSPGTCRSQDRFLPNPIQFMSHQSYHPTL
jgi:hypothetical protein